MQGALPLLPFFLVVSVPVSIAAAIGRMESTDAPASVWPRDPPLVRWIVDLTQPGANPALQVLIGNGQAAAD